MSEMLQNGQIFMKSHQILLSTKTNLDLNKYFLSRRHLFTLKKFSQEDFLIEKKTKNYQNNKDLRIDNSIQVKMKSSLKQEIENWYLSSKILNFKVKIIKKKQKNPNLHLLMINLTRFIWESRIIIAKIFLIKMKMIQIPKVI